MKIIRLDLQAVCVFFRKKVKKYFGSLEKGCTFAPAFDRKAEYIETDEKIEIACVDLHM